MPDGSSWPTFETACEELKTVTEKKDEITTLVSNPHAHAMMLGTLLGDGCIPNPEHFWYKKRYTCNHCLEQKDYMAAKALILKDLNPQMDIRPNPGYVEDSVAAVVYTKCSLALEPYWSLCYSKPEVKEDGTVRMKKYVTKGWVEQLTWEAIAWWIQDDGSLSGNCYNISTHSFEKEELSNLHAWFAEHGFKSKDAPRIAEEKKNGKTYNVLRFNTAASRRLALKIAPYVHPSMQYKLDVSSTPETCTCEICGKEFKTTTNRASSMRLHGTVFCPDCRPVMRRRYKDTYLAKFDPEEVRAKWREQKRREYAAGGAEKRKQYYSLHKEKIAAQARARRQGVAVGEEIKSVKVTCAYCGEEFEADLKTYNSQTKHGTYRCKKAECKRAHSAALSRHHRSMKKGLTDK